MKSLRARLFAATLGALAVTLALTIGIGAVLTRRQVDRVQVADLARRADDIALQRRTSVSYVNRNTVSQKVHVLISPRPELNAYVPDVNRSSDGQTTYKGEHFLYSYRTLPSRGLLVLQPPGVSQAWRPFLRDLLLSALAMSLLLATISSNQAMTSSNL